MVEPSETEAVASCAVRAGETTDRDVQGAASGVSGHLAPCRHHTLPPHLHTGLAREDGEPRPRGLRVDVAHRRVDWATVGARPVAIGQPEDCGRHRELEDCRWALRVDCRRMRTGRARRWTSRLPRLTRCRCDRAVADRHRALLNESRLHLSRTERSAPHVDLVDRTEEAVQLAPGIVADEEVVGVGEHVLEPALARRTAADLATVHEQSDGAAVERAHCHVPTPVPHAGAGVRRTGVRRATTA